MYDLKWNTGNPPPDPTSKRKLLDAFDEPSPASHGIHEMLKKYLLRIRNGGEIYFAIPGF